MKPRGQRQPPGLNITYIANKNYVSLKCSWVCIYCVSKKSLLYKRSQVFSMKYGNTSWAYSIFTVNYIFFAFNLFLCRVEAALAPMAHWMVSVNLYFMSISVIDLSKSARIYIQFTRETSKSAPTSSLQFRAEYIQIYFFVSLFLSLFLVHIYLSIYKCSDCFTISFFWTLSL